MAQPPVADFYEDKETRLHRRRTGRRSYLIAVPITGLVLAVAILGAVGPRNAPAHSGATAGSSGIGPASVEPTETGQAIWSPPVAALPTFGIAGFRALIVNNAMNMTLGAGVNPMDADGADLLYGLGNDLFIANAATQSEPVHVATGRPCGWVTQAAMSDVGVIYAEVVPPGAPGDASATCPDFYATAEWHVTIVDRSTRTAREVGSGTYSGLGQAGPAEAAPAVDIAESVYSFSRPEREGHRAVVEVHDLGQDKRFYASDPLAIPMQIELADSRLTVSVPSSDDSTLVGQRVVLATDSWGSPLTQTAITMGPVSLSRDGRRLAFSSCEDMPCRPAIRLQEEAGPATYLPAPPTWLSVDSVSSALQTVAWVSPTNLDSSFSNDQTWYLGLKCNRWAEPVLLSGIRAPSWVHVQDDTLLWVSFDPSDGSAQLSQLELQSAFQGW